MCRGRLEPKNLKTDLEGTLVETGPESGSQMKDIDWGVNYLSNLLRPGENYSITIEPGKWTVKLVDTGEGRYYVSCVVDARKITDVDIK